MGAFHGSRTALGALLLATAAPLAAQVAAPPATVEGARSFTPEDFARFAPRNALDMLRQVPGFVIREATQERGLGQATGNVLINGQRLSGKTADAVTELSRISAENVVRIDIVDGATLDIPGLSGQVANILTEAGGLTGQFAWRPEFRAHHTNPLLTRFELSVNGKTGPFEYTLGLENQGFRSGAGGPTDIFRADGSLIERRDDVWTGKGEQPRATARIVYDGPGSSIGNLNLAYRRFHYDYRERGLRVGPGLVDRVRLVGTDEDSRAFEIGGDYEFALAGGRLKLIGLLRDGRIPAETRVQTDFADFAPRIGSRFTRLADESERIARAEYRWNSGGADWQISAEGAFNSLDNVSRLFELTPEGEYRELPLPGGSGRVEEDRYEIMGSYGRSLAPNLSIQLSAGGEYSRLSQVGPGGLVRSFYRPKGQASAAWKPSPRTDVNLKLQRRVGQLNFFDFLATVNLGDDRENAGNPDLVPPQSWEAEIETVRNLGRYGTTSLRLYGRLIDDIVDIVPIGATGESVGNLDSAIVYGAEWKGTLNLDPFGWRGAKIDARAMLQGSRVQDPLTGENRPISNSLQRFFSIDLRHDVPGSDWAWGSNVNHEWRTLNYRLTEVGRQWEGPLWGSLFVEHKDVMGLTVRAAIANALGARSYWDRTVYAGRRDGPIAFIERRDRLIGPIFAFSVRGTF